MSTPCKYGCGTKMASVEQAEGGTHYERHRRMEDQEVRCLNEGPDCEGAVEYRMALSGTGVSFLRCDKHWSDRLDQEEVTRERYPEHPPADWSPYDAGESWDEDY